MLMFPDSEPEASVDTSHAQVMHSVSWPAFSHTLWIALCSRHCVSIDIGTELQNWWKAMCSLGLASYSHLFFSQGYLSVFVWFPSRPCLEKKKVLWKVLLLADDSFAFSWFFFFWFMLFYWWFYVERTNRCPWKISIKGMVQYIPMRCVACHRGQSVPTSKDQLTQGEAKYTCALICKFSSQTPYRYNKSDIPR